jgi:uncharacterized protein
MPDYSDSILINALQNPAIYPHNADHLEIVETHISWVILVGEFAYKIKKPLNLGFLDFSTLEKRRFCCEEELRLNSRLAPTIYLAVIAIHGSSDNPQLDNTGTVLEYAVKMRRFNRAQTFDHLLESRRLEAFHLKATAHIIADFHALIPRVDAASDFGSPETLFRPVRENYTQISNLPDINSRIQLAQLRDWSEQSFLNLRNVLIQRKQDGFVRECHGDLHLKNIAWLNDTAIPFDGIEFNPTLYWIDVISEVAFLLMDLSARKRPDLAFLFLNAYLEHSGDYAGLAVLPFYLVYRAVVMAKVSAIRAHQLQHQPAIKQTLKDFHNYLQLAEYYTYPTQPMLLIMHGVSCSGKSWLSEQMATRLSAIRIRSDVERKRLFGDKPSALLYSAELSEQTYQRLENLADAILKAGFTVIVDATFLNSEQRQAFNQLAEQRVITFRIIHTHCAEQILHQRLQQRTATRKDVSDADTSVLHQQLQNQQPLSQTERHATLSIDTNSTNSLNQFWQQLESLT